MKKLLSEFTIFFTNKVGILLVLINFVLALSGLFLKEFAYKSFHFIYEPLPIKILIFLNFPAMVAAGLISAVFFPSNNRPSSVVNIGGYEFITIVICSIFQWLLIGYIFNKLFFKKELK